VSKLALEAPDYVAPVHGWRVWLVDATGATLKLASIIYDTIWPSGEPFAAECLRKRRSRRRPWRSEYPDHAVPAARCGCGIYALRSATELSPYLNGNSDRAHGMATRLVGSVALWGTVVEAERGWRASRAYPSSLYLPVFDETSDPRWTDVIEHDLGAYSVPVEVVETQSMSDLLACLDDRLPGDQTSTKGA
jgi:hypothetical protein